MPPEDDPPGRHRFPPVYASEEEFKRLRKTMIDLGVSASDWQRGVILAALDRVDSGVATAATPPLQTTARGFAYAEFVDSYGDQCSIQDSSNGEYAAIWLGVATDFEGNRVNARMHLNQAQAAALLPLLQRFVETGSISEEG